MSLSTGDKLGPYEITAPLGKGGMGEVWGARDPKLDRDVAIKVLPDLMARDKERVLRFEREAKLLASLNHPNIAQIYGFEEHRLEAGVTHFLVLEYVEGETLAARIKRGALPVDEALEVCKQVAEALEAAHEKGVIHRDLKPANVMVKADGAVKVLDFGLARAMQDDSGGASVTPDSPTIVAHSPTITADFTQPGVVLGTAPYMSPEQARGRPLDKRTDIWSFGVMLYECLTGQMLFHGETATDSLGAIMHKTVDLDRIPPDTPSTVRHLLRRCLERDRKQRLRDIGDARIELDLAQRADATTDVARTTSGRAPIVMVSAVVVGAVLLLAGYFVGTRFGPVPARTPTFVSVDPPPGMRIRATGDLAGPPVVSPDGTMIAFAAQHPGESQVLAVRRLDEPESRLLEGTASAMFPFWSPDSRSIGFFTSNAMRRVDVASGAVRTICPVSEARGGAWTRDGRILFSPRFSAAIQMVDASGGTPTQITQIDESLHNTHRWPAILPDSKHFLYMAANREAQMREKNAIYIGSFDGAAPRRLMRSDFGVQVVNDWLLFVRDGRILASRVDLTQARLTGEPVVLARDAPGDLATWHAQFSASETGILVFRRIPAGRQTKDAGGSPQPNALHGADRVTFIDRLGRSQTYLAEGMPNAGLALSPDGRTIAIPLQSRDGSYDLWLYPSAYRAGGAVPAEEVAAAVMAPSPTRLTFLEGSERKAVWSPDGDELAFHWDGGGDTGKAGIYRKRVGGGREELLLAQEDQFIVPQDWSPDGKYILYRLGDWLPSAVDDIWVLPLDGADPFPLIQSPESQNAAGVSPDGRWLTYYSDESGQVEVYVIPFAPQWPEDARERRWQVSLSGGASPRWSADGKELFYITRGTGASGSLVAVTVSMNGDMISFDSGKPLFPAPVVIGASYGPVPNSSAFVFSDRRAAPDAPISVLLNWTQLLEDSRDK